MVSRNNYVGPLTKSAEAMFARAERRALAQARGSRRVARGPSPARLAIEALGLSLSVVRHWEDAGAVAIGREGGRRIIDAAALETLSLVARLREAGLSVREIAWLSRAGPPTASALRKALEASLSSKGLPDTPSSAPRSNSSL